MRIFLIFATFILTFVFFYGCKNVKKQIVEKNDHVKTVVIPEVVDVKNADIICDFDYIILEAKENSYFGYVSKMRVYQGRIYILDDTYAKSLLIFTIKGDHIATVGDKKGRGPLEFVSVTNFEIDYVNNQLMVMDNFGYKFMIYDLEGNFIKRINSNIPVFDAVLLPNGCILHAKATGDPKMPVKSNCQIIIADDKKRIIKEGFEYDDNKNFKFHIFDFIRAQPDGGFNFAPKFRDTIYSVSFDSITPKYAIDYGNNKKIQKSTIDGLGSTHDLYELINHGGNMCFMGEHVESEDFLYLSLGHMINQFCVFFNKQTRNAIAIHNKAQITEYELYNILCSDSDGYFYGTFNFANMDELIKLFPKMKKLDAVEEMNPILFRYKVKI